MLDLYEIGGDQRVRLESQWRPQGERLTHGVHGSAVIRDQQPLPERELKAVLRGMEPLEWYRLINGKTFFWADLQSLVWMLGAITYRNRTHSVLTIDTRRLLDRHIDRVWLTDQNSGSVYGNKPRGLYTFRKVGTFNSPWVKEIAVDYSVPDIEDLTIRVEEWRRDRKLRQIWPRESN